MPVFIDDLVQSTECVECAATAPSLAKHAKPVRRTSLVPLRPARVCSALQGERVHRKELALCEELLQRLTDSENEISRAFRRGNLSADAWNAQLKEIVADRRVLERKRDAAREQLAVADVSAISIDDVETQLEELQDRVRAAALKDRKAIIESVIPGDQPFGIVIWPDGKIDIRDAIPVPHEPPVAKPSSLPAQEP